MVRVKAKWRTTMSMELVGCCGIYCGACPFYRSNIPDLARKLEGCLEE